MGRLKTSPRKINRGENKMQADAKINTSQYPHGSRKI
jgi:hypothetical protein